MTTVTTQMIKLFTSNQAFVKEVSIPPFNSMPEVIIWGIRIFKRGLIGYNEYYECFAYTIIEEATNGED